MNGQRGARGRTGKKAYRITLSCGCRTMARNEPMPKAQMSCDTGLGHGHKLTWVSVVHPDGTVRRNRA